jgi:acyl carrier protein
VSTTLEEVIATALNISASKVADPLAFNSIPEWDSLAHVNLMLSLEEAYGVPIDEDRMVELTSVRAIRKFLGEGVQSA